MRTRIPSLGLVSRRRPLTQIYTSRPFLRISQRQQRQQQQRHNSSSSETSSASAHTAFWKTFGRPLSKVLLAAFLTYQLAYLGWTKLEFLETREEIEAEMEKLEAEARLLVQRSKQGKGKE